MRAKQQFQAVVNEAVLQNRPRVKVSKLGAMMVLTVDGRPFAGFFGEAMTFRLSGADRDRALKLKGSKPLGIVSGKDLNEWVQVPVLQVGHWRPLTELALAQQARSES